MCQSPGIGAMKHPVLVGIFGMTCSGKTTATMRIVDHFKEYDSVEVVCFHQDDYYIEDKSLLMPIPELNHWDYEVVGAVDFAQMAKDLENELKKVPENKKDTKIILCDGHMIHQSPDIMNGVSFDLMFYISQSHDLIRTIRFTRIYEPPDPDGYFERCVWPATETQLVDARNHKDITVIESQDYEEIFRRILIPILRILYRDWIHLTHRMLSVDHVVAFVADHSCGATATFSGTTRNNFEDKIVTGLSYEAYKPMALKELHKIAVEARQKWSDINRIAILHRLEDCPVGETSVLIAISAPHRRASLDACSWIIDELKSRVPIFKKEHYDNDTTSWKANAESLVGERQQ